MGPHTQNPQEQSLPREKGELAPLSKVERRGKTPAPCVARVLINIPSRPLKLFLIFLLLRQRPGKVISNGQQRKQNIARPVCREAVGASERYDGGRKREREREEEGRKKKEALGRLLLIRRRRSESFRGPGEFRQCSNSSAARIHTDHSVISLFPSYTLYVYIYIYHVTCHLCRSPSPFL